MRVRAAVEIRVDAVDRASGAVPGVAACVRGTLGAAAKECALNLGSAEVVERFPVMRPALPTFDRLEPYLRRIDRARAYTNNAQLACEFETRLGALLGVPGGVASASSGTAAIVAAILATAGRATAQRPFALLPAYTFVATALAVELCGYRPLVADVEASDWMLSAERALAHAARAPIGVVVPVAPYGRAFERSSWERFRSATGIPVVIDGAASFDVLAYDRATAAAALGSIPVALSFHATKSLSTAEGGAVIAADREVVGAAARALNLGFAGSRECGVASFNGKLSEYHAAIGLAELDAWPNKRDALLRVAFFYRRAASSAGLGDRIFTAPVVSGCYVLLEHASQREAAAVHARLADAHIGSRFWYGDGLHRHAHLRDVEREPVPNAEDIARRLLGLPMAVDFTAHDVESIVAVVARAS